MEKREHFVEALIAILVAQKAFMPNQVQGLQQTFQNASHEYFEDFLLEEGLVDKGALLTALAQYYQVPEVDVVGIFFEPFLLQKFPKDFLLRNAFIPLEVADEGEFVMYVVAAEPNNDDLLAKIGEFVSYDIHFRVGLRRDICDAVKEFYDRSFTADVDEFGEELVDDQKDQAEVFDLSRTDNTDQDVNPTGAMDEDLTSDDTE